MLAAVWVPTLDDAGVFRNLVRHLRALRGWRANYEFKFSKTHGIRDLRAEFYGLALSREFRFAVSSTDETQSHWERSDRQELHLRAAATELAALMRPTYEEAEKAKPMGFRELVVVDDNRDAEFLAVLKRQFRGTAISAIGSPFCWSRFVPELGRSDEMLQLADMVCGAASAYLDGSDPIWYEMIAERNVETWWGLPENEMGPRRRTLPAP